MGKARKGGRQDLVDKETAEIVVLETYLPQAASAEEIEQAVAAALAETGATSMKEMGAVMKAVLAHLAGKNPDGRAVSEAVKRNLTPMSSTPHLHSYPLPSPLTFLSPPQR